MNKRPDLTINMDSELFKEYYYLKEELVTFCRENSLPTNGNKEELTNRVHEFLKTGRIIKSSKKHAKKSSNIVLDESSLIEDDFVCTEVHREFFKKKIGDRFSFNVAFQKWLKANTNKTYLEAINAYYDILQDKKNNETIIDKQFEYNTYIRDFFSNNSSLHLTDAIKCWKYKKSLPGHNKYEEADLLILELS